MTFQPQGWYPDPVDDTQLRWWDGNDWGDATQSRSAAPTQWSAAGPPPPPKSRRVPLLIVAGVVGVTVLVVAITSAMSGGDSDDGTTSAASSAASTPATTTPAPAVTAQPTAAAPASTCSIAPEQIVATINGSFADSGLQLSAPAYAVTVGDLTYVGADVLRGSSRESSSDVWVARGGETYSVSGSARELSALPDGRRALDVNAGDQYGLAVQDCVNAAR